MIANGLNVFRSAAPMSLAAGAAITTFAAVTASAGDDVCMLIITDDFEERFDNRR
jgi:hypothetical protein